MNGPHLDDELSALLDGELDQPELAEARTHLAECAVCTAELAALDRTRSLVRSLPPVDAPLPLRPRDDADALAGAGRERPPGPARWLPAAAAAIALLLLQALPSVEEVSPSLAGLTQAHAATAVAGEPVAAHMRAELPAQGDWDEFDMVPVVRQVPAPKKYTVTTQPGGTVASRPVLHAVVRESSGRVVEELELDEQTGLVLRRTVYDGAGRVARVAQVDWVDAAAAPAVTPPTQAPDGRVDPPETLDGDYQRVAVFRRGPVVHALYFDGLHALSVFAEAGDLDPPSGGTPVLVGERRARHYARPGGEVLLWESGGIVYTAVGDGPVEDVVRAAASMPGPKEPSLAERFRQGCRDVAEALVG